MSLVSLSRIASDPVSNFIGMIVETFSSCILESVSRSVVPSHSLKLVLAVERSNHCLIPVRVEVSSNLNRDYLILVCCSSDSLCSEVPFEPFMNVRNVIIVESKSVLVASNVFVPEESLAGNMTLDSECLLRK